MALTDAPDVSIGALSAAAGVHIETIRYYERIGILPKPPRRASGHRVYCATDTRRVAFVRRCRELGFSLDEVRELLVLSGDRVKSCGEVRDITRAHLDVTRGKIADLVRLSKTLQSLADACERQDQSRCPIIEALFDEDR